VTAFSSGTPGSEFIQNSAIGASGNPKEKCWP
jgi:hypothetical protein